MQVCRAGPTAEIQVSDTGQGIPSNRLPFVFNQFWQADHSATRSNTGVGLGLAIAKHLVSAQGGSIDVASEGEGLGCMFTVRLPLAGMPAIPPACRPAEFAGVAETCNSVNRKKDECRSRFTPA